MKNAKLKIDIDTRSYNFALQIIKLVRILPKEMAAIQIGRQLVRSGTSVAANIEEAQAACSKDDFIYKMNIALKEARETHLWLRLVKDSNFFKDDNLLIVLSKECFELKNILGAIVKSSKGK